MARDIKSENEDEEVLQVLKQRFPHSLWKAPCQKRDPLLQSVENPIRSRFMLKNHRSWKGLSTGKASGGRSIREETLWTDPKLHSPSPCTRDKVEKWGMK